MGAFERAFNFTVRRWEAGGDPEGGYVNHPSDPGGETRWGVSKRAHPDLDIRALTEEQARAVYREGYWDPIRGDELPPGVGLAVFDWVVHSDRRTVVVPRLQRLVGAKPDGLLGPKTSAAIWGAAPDPARDADLAERIVDSRVRFLVGLMRGSERYRAFEVGWMRRMASVAAQAVRSALA